MTKGQIEAQICSSIKSFEKEHMGRGPKETKVYIIEDMVFVRLTGVLTPAEKQLAKSEQGADLIKRSRVELLESSRYLLEKIITDITGLCVTSLHTDISTKTGERVIIFTMEQNIEFSD